MINSARWGLARQEFAVLAACRPVASLAVASLATVPIGCGIPRWRGRILCAPVVEVVVVAEDGRHSDDADDKRERHHRWCHCSAELASTAGRTGRVAAASLGALRKILGGTVIEPTAKRWGDFTRRLLLLLAA